MLLRAKVNTNQLPPTYKANESEIINRRSEACKELDSSDQQTISIKLTYDDTRGKAAEITNQSSNVPNPKTKDPVGKRLWRSMVSAINCGETRNESIGRVDVTVWNKNIKDNNRKQQHSPSDLCIKLIATQPVSFSKVEISRNQNMSDTAILYTRSHSAT